MSSENSMFKHPSGNRRRTDLKVGHYEIYEPPASEGGPYNEENLAEEPAEEGLLPGFTVYFGYGFG
jgi:hypothetical protein